MHRTVILGLGTLAAAAAGCAGDDITPTGDLSRRAYVVSRDSDELTVIDLDRQAVIGQVATRGIANHMAEISADLRTVYVVSSDTDEVVVVDALSLEVTGRIPVAGHPTHVSRSWDGGLLAVAAEDDDAVAFIDTTRNVEVARVGDLLIPHFVRWSKDGATAYVANIGGHHLTTIDVASLTATGTIELDGFAGRVEAADETGFADAQIDHDGVLWAAHAATGRVLVYDTVAGAKLGEVPVGARPWVAFAEHPFPELARRHLVPSFGDRTVSVIDGGSRAVVADLPGDEEAYGVNFSSLAPDRAFVMNRVRADVAVVDTARGEVTARIPVGGNTETAASSADGASIVAAVSGADRVVILDPVTESVVATLDGVGRYPWSVTIPDGQNYCH